MSDLKMSDDQILYCLQNLAGYEPDDIDCDDVDIAVNDDQFASISIVRTAELGAELIAKQQEQIELLREALKSIMNRKSATVFSVNHCCKMALEATTKG